ncbi:hypothetical protein DXG01_011912 [Tephrocybe rancida]|nr:hypothetical protein DXG01_011912 [Tephrocybe rancida]
MPPQRQRRHAQDLPHKQVKKLIGLPETGQLSREVWTQLYWKDPLLTRRVLHYPPETRPMPPPLIEDPERRFGWLLDFSQALEKSIVAYAFAGFYTEGCHFSIPHPVDLCIMPRILDLYRAMRPNIKSDALVAQISPLLDSVIAEWMAITRTQLMRVLLSSILSLEPDSTTTLAALALIQCSICSCVRTIHTAQFHSCCNRPYEADDVVAGEQTLPMTVQAMYTRRAWSPDSFKILPGSMIRIQLLLTAICDGNIRKTTCEELNALDCKLVCRLCAIDPEGSVRSAMHWRTARLD